MRPSDALRLHRDRIREIALDHRVTNPRVFGSVLRGEDTEGSDLDILVEPTADATLFDIGAIQYELTELLGIRIDVLTPASLPESFRHIVVSESVPI
ncbi:nucleotidyltransferase family protein [Ramlibacter sp.]|uniref:nucleotidyltransferase family protein n=1 Tax=Ramlibacter sp. TaxID=1917967 RepID=UPI0035B44F28